MANQLTDSVGLLFSLNLIGAFLFQNNLYICAISFHRLVIDCSRSPL